MAFSKADGTAGAFNGDGSVAGAAFKGAISVGTNSSVDGSVFDIKGNVPDDPNLPPVKEGVNNAAARGGTWNNLDSASIMAIGADSAKTANTSPGGDGSNNTNTNADVVSDSNYKTLINAGISPGDPDWDASFAVTEEGVWDVSQGVDTASDLKLQYSDAANDESIVFAGAAQPQTTFVTAPIHRCPCDTLALVQYKVPTYRFCASPFDDHPTITDKDGNTASKYFCTGAIEYQWEVRHTSQPRRPIDCTLLSDPSTNAILYLGYTAALRNVTGSNGRCFLKPGVHHNASITTMKGISGVPGGEGYNCQRVCGAWMYYATPIDSTGGRVGAPVKIRELEFSKFSATAMSCPSFTEAYYQGLVGAMDAPPTYTVWNCPLPGA
jgi:hypothetical protein